MSVVSRLRKPCARGSPEFIAFAQPVTMMLWESQLSNRLLIQIFNWSSIYGRSTAGCVCRVTKVLQNQVSGMVVRPLWKLERRNWKLGSLPIPGVMHKSEGKESQLWWWWKAHLSCCVKAMNEPCPSKEVMRLFLLLLFYFRGLC